MKFALALIATSMLGMVAHADDADTAKANLKETAKDVKVDAKKAGRKVEDETCEMVNGKMECAAKKAKHKVQNATDEVTK